MFFLNHEIDRNFKELDSEDEDFIHALTRKLTLVDQTRLLVLLAMSILDHVWNVPFHFFPHVRPVALALCPKARTRNKRTPIKGTMSNINFQVSSSLATIFVMLEMFWFFQVPGGTGGRAEQPAGSKSGDREAPGRAWAGDSTEKKGWGGVRWWEEEEEEEERSRTAESGAPGQKPQWQSAASSANGEGCVRKHLVQLSCKEPKW